MNDFEPSSLPAAARDFQPEWGMVLGSGLGSMVEQLEIAHAIPFGEIPQLPQSRVPGHAGRFVFAEVAGRRAVIAQGRVHLYESHSASAVTAGIRFMAALGISKLILTNAAGSVNAAFAPGTWMMLTDHLNLTGASPLTGGPNFIDMTEVYSARMRAAFRKSAAELGLMLGEGTYAGLPGPQYETPAEIRMLKALGADAVGMSTVLEAIQARSLGLEIAGFSCLTNWGAGLGQTTLHHQEVIEMGKVAAGDFVRLLHHALPNC